MNDLVALFRYQFRGVTVAGLPRRFIGTICLALAVGLCSGYTARYSPGDYDRILDRFGFSWELLTKGRLWQIFSENFIQSTPGLEWSMVAMVISSFVICEAVAGTRPLIVAFFATDWMASISTVTTLKVLSLVGYTAADRFVTEPDAGTSASVHGAYAIAAAMLPVRMAAALWTALFAFTIVMLRFQSLDAAIAHLWAVGYGGAITVWRLRRPVWDAVERDRAMLA